MFVRLQYRKREAVRQHLTKLEKYDRLSRLENYSAEMKVPFFLPKNKADRDSHFGALLKIPLNQREEK